MKNLVLFEFPQLKLKGLIWEMFIALKLIPSQEQLQRAD